MSATIHPAADVHPSAELGEGVRIDAGAVVEAHCKIGAHTHIGRHTIIWAHTQMGSGNRIFPFCSLGGEPQDKKYQGEHAPLQIGDDNTIREYCFINQGTAASGSTRIGSGNWIMAYVHVAHDCIIGNRTVIANAVQFAGHVEVADEAIIGGGALFHQFRRVGAGAMVGGGEKMRYDIPPYALTAEGVVSVNSEGMTRRGHPAAAIAAMRRAYKTLYRDGLALPAAAAQIAAMPEAAEADSPLAQLAAFLHLPDLHLLRPRHTSSG